MSFRENEWRGEREREHDPRCLSARHHPIPRIPQAISQHPCDVTKSRDCSRSVLSLFGSVRFYFFPSLKFSDKFCDFASLSRNPDIIQVIFFKILYLFRQNTYLRKKKHTLTCQGGTGYYKAVKSSFLKFNIFQWALNQICVIQIALYRSRTLRIRLYQISGCQINSSRHCVHFAGPSSSRVWVSRIHG